MASWLISPTNLLCAVVVLAIVAVLTIVLVSQVTYTLFLETIADQYLSTSSFSMVFQSLRTPNYRNVDQNTVPSTS